MLPTIAPVLKVIDPGDHIPAAQGIAPWFAVLAAENL